jgi:hypothetical protein
LTKNISKKRGALKEYQIIIKSKFFSLLFKVDKDLSEQLKKTLSPCYGMRLHVGHYLRKVRGIDDIENAHNIKFSFNCSKCRSRVNPTSLRFFNRIIFASSFFILISALMNNNDYDLKLAAKKFDIDIKTLKRWKSWWIEVFPATEIFKKLQGHFSTLIELAPQYFLNHFNQDRIIEDSLLFTLKLLIDSS